MKITLTNILKAIMAYGLIISGSVNRAKNKALQGNYILGIYFHDPSYKEFKNTINWLKKNNFQFITPQQLTQIIQKKQEIPKGAVIITVDDGWRDNEKNMVALAEKFEIPITIFVSTEPVENGTYWWSKVLQAKKNHFNKAPSVQELKKLPNEERLFQIEKLKQDNVNGQNYRDAMDIDQIKRISKSKYVHIGGHTHTHPILPNCSYNQVYEELELSKKKLESWTNKEITTFAYPNGDYSFREISILKKLDYQLAFTCEPEKINPHNISNPYLIPRFAFLEGASQAENICRIMGLWQPLRDKFRAIFSNQPVVYSEYKYKNKSV
ncbi:polysaccharide deacetylase family protein [Echinicola jeungdonensis]|uniref:Polysaccharide deacetylase family protein n=1 Tax=Echinicola jeungdonensis TaxID=709343 RepID=A0ABV5J086_9BACT|nr:polysaccharide deacetylase family protein [Echinicola jeungdonensis]MDN3671162.1 polysaccharide deacetylase family protein [Echinicola jeungdonensis]